MADEESSRMPEDKSKPELQKIRYEAGIPILPGPEDDAEAYRDAKDQHQALNEDKQIVINGRIAWFTGALVICTIITAGINGWQAWVAQDAAAISMKAALIAQRSERSAQKSAEQQSRQSSLAIKAAIDQFELANRAYLSIEEPISQSEEKWRSVIVPIVNYGHVSSVIHSVKLQYDRLPATIPAEDKTITALESRNIAVMREQVIAPGPAGFKISFDSPAYPKETAKALTLANEHLRIDGDIFYSTGFGGIDSTRFCVYYQNPQGGWHSCSGRGISIGAESGKQDKHRKYIVK